MKDNFLSNIDPFIDKQMLNVMTEQKVQVENECVKAILNVAVDVDETKVKQWLERAKMLDEIDNSSLIDIAVSKKMGQLKKEIKQLRKQNRHLTEIIDGYESN